MDDRLKQRLVGATVLVLAAVVFVPMLLDRDEAPPPRSERLIARVIFARSFVRAFY